MDIMDGKIDGGKLSIALLLITGRTRATRLQINPASISIGISGYLQRLLDGIINCKPGNFAWFNSCNTASPSLLTGDAITIIKTNSVRADLTGNTISGNESINNFPACTQTSGIYSRQPDVITLACENRKSWYYIGQKEQQVTKFIYSSNTAITTESNN